MRLAIGVVAATLALGGVARAQGGAAAAASPEKGYVEAVGQSSFGNVTSQNFGVEGEPSAAAEDLFRLYKEFQKTS